MAAQPSQWIESSPDVLGGKPRIRGTRISVEFLLELLAGGASRDEILEAYPQVTADGFSAALEYALSAVRGTGRERREDRSVSDETGRRELLSLDIGGSSEIDPADASRRDLAQIAVILRAMDMEDEAPRWMHTPLPRFGGKTPVEIVEAGRGQELVAGLIAQATGNIGS